MARLSPTIVCCASTLARSARFSACSRRWRRALRTTSTFLSSDSGFSTKSNAPILMARTAASTLPWPEMTPTSPSNSRSRIRVSVARPSMRGSQMSSTTTSYGWRPRRSRQASPLSTASTVYPSSRRTPPRALRTPGSSSTIRMEDIANDGAGLKTGSYGSTWQLDHEAGAARNVVGHVDGATVLRHDPAHDGKPQTAAPLLGRVVRQEQLLALGRRDARSVVGHDDPQQIVPFVVLGGQADDAGAVHRLDGVVHEIQDHAPHLLGIDRYPRHPVAVPALETDARQQPRVERECAEI